MALEIVMPRLSDSMEEGTIVQWLVSAGDHVDEGQPLVEVETDKASVVYEAETAGSVLALRAAEGESVAVGAPIAVIGEPGDERRRARGGSDGHGAARATEAAPGCAQVPRPKASPLARRIAAERGVDLAALAGSGPQGRVIRADVDAPRPRALWRHRGSRAGPGDTALPLRQGRLDGPPAQPLRSRRSRGGWPSRERPCPTSSCAARSTRASWSRCASGCARSPIRPPSLNDFIVKAAALALREFPRVNAAYRDAGASRRSRA